MTVAALGITGRARSAAVTRSATPAKGASASSPAATRRGGMAAGASRAVGAAFRSSPAMGGSGALRTAFVSATSIRVP